MLTVFIWGKNTLVDRFESEMPMNCIKELLESKLAINQKADVYSEDGAFKHLRRNEIGIVVPLSRYW